MVLALLLAACGEVPADPPRFAGDDCRRLSVIDRETGRPVVGAEDLLALPDGALVLSAYDRLGRAGSAPAGLYRVRWPAESGAEATADRIWPPRGPGGSPRPVEVRPHGIALLARPPDGDTAAIVVLDRGPARVAGDLAAGDGLWLAGPAVRIIERRSADPAAPWTETATVADPVLCNGNDLAALDSETLLVTLDRGGCDGLGWAEGVFAPYGGRVGRVTLAESTNGRGSEGTGRVGIAADGLAFANGIAVGPDPIPSGAATTGKRVAVAATRGREILLFDGAALAAGTTEAPAEPIARVELGENAPDNLGVSANGDLTVAVHPSLFRLALVRYGVLGAERAGSRALAVGPDGRTELLFDDPSGRLFSAMTAAILVDGRLVGGSVVDAGLLVCHPSDP